MAGFFLSQRVALKMQRCNGISYASLLPSLLCLKHKKGHAKCMTNEQD